MRRFIFLFLALGFPVFLSAQTKPAKKPAAKHAAVKVQNHAMFKLVVKAPFTGLKGIAYSGLFTAEVITDGARVGLTAADTIFDVISIKGKVPILDNIYAFVGVGAKDAAWLDVHEEGLETDLFGTHN